MAESKLRSVDENGEKGPHSTKILRFNVGGTCFQTRESTLLKFPCLKTHLLDQSFLDDHFVPETQEYFFDRDPEIFRCVINYVRTGKLHLPASVCGPVIKDELEFWGIQDIQIEACCWTGYNSWISTLEALKQLERDRKRHVYYQLQGTRVWKIRIAIWRFLTNHRSSIPAQIYGWVSLVFVMVAIFSFCAATHATFQIPATTDQQNGTSNTSSHQNHQNASGNTSTTSSQTSTSKIKRRSFHDLDDTHTHPVLVYTDLVCLVFFTAEFVLRLICAPQRIKFFFTPLSIIDLLAILPDYIEFIVYAINPEVARDTTFVECMPFLRLMRAFRIFRLIRHIPGLWVMFYTLKASYKDLALMLIFLLVAMLLFSSLIYFVDDQKTFTSIPHGFWWAVVTMTTVGYGDMYPTKNWGYVIGSFTAVAGVLVIGFTIPALVTNFALYYQHVDFAIQKEKHLLEQLKQESEINSAYSKGQKGTHEHMPLVRLQPRDTDIVT